MMAVTKMVKRSKRPTTVRALLLCAAKLLETRWTRDAYFTRPKKGTNEPTKASRFCVLGALRYCAGYYELDEPEADRRFAFQLALQAERQLERHLAERHLASSSVAHFNDQEARKAKEVVALLQKAAKALA